jgi:hypothetical protein
MESQNGSAMTDGQFGAGCAAVPTDAANPGSFDAMAKVPVATAASGNPLLSTLVTAVKEADLVDTLNSAQGVTVFAPVLRGREATADRVARHLGAVDVRVAGASGRVRAVDGRGDVQTGDRATPFPDRVTGWHSVAVTAT